MNQKDIMDRLIQLSEVNMQVQGEIITLNIASLKEIIYCFMKFYSKILSTEPGLGKKAKKEFESHALLTLCAIFETLIARQDLLPTLFPILTLTCSKLTNDETSPIKWDLIKSMRIIIDK